MNYNNLNSVYDYWNKDMLPYLSHNFTVASFDDYLKRMAYLPTCKWIYDGEKIKITRIPFAIDPKKFVKKYKDVCVTYNCPIRPEDGFQRIIYQISPTIHLEISIWIWIEHKVLQSYAFVFICYHDENEYFKFVDDIHKMRREGDTEEKNVKGGFASLIDS